MTTLRRPARRYMKSSSPVLRSALSPTRRWASCSPAGLIPHSSVPLPLESALTSPYAPLPSAWTPTRSTSSTPREVADYIGSEHTRGHHHASDDGTRFARDGHRTSSAPMTSRPSAPAWACICSARAIHENDRHPRAADGRDLRRAVRL